MADPAYRSKHYLEQRKLWAATLAAGEQVTCHRCRQPIAPGAPFDLDHVLPVSDGGTGGPLAPSHPSCNRSHGATTGNRMRADRFSTGSPPRYPPFDAPPSREWFRGATLRWAHRCERAGYNPDELLRLYGQEWPI